MNQDGARVVLLGYDGVDELDLFGAYAVLSKASSGRSTEPADRLTVDIVAATPAVTCAGGATVLVHRDLGAVGTADAVVVPGGRGAERAAADPLLTTVLRGALERGALLYAICSGAFLLAAAGVTGAALAVHHDKRDRLRRFGVTRVASGLIRDGNVCSVGGDHRASVKSVDLAFAVLADLAQPLVEEVAVRMEVFPGRPVPAPAHAFRSGTGDPSGHGWSEPARVV